MDKRALKKIKKYVLIFGGIALMTSLAYATGTFFPNPWVEKKLTDTKESSMIKEWKSYGLFAPSIEYSNEVEFILAVGKCIGYHNLMLSYEKRIHRDIIVAMAVLETGYGESRFAKEGNNLFGIRTWNPKVPQLKPRDLPKAKFGVKKYETKCDSVLDMIEIINRHPAYEGFRIVRTEQLKTGVVDLDKQIDELHKWSTNPDYTKLVKSKAKDVEKILIKHYGNGK